MQNKGAIRFIAIALALVCLYQLSFTWVTKRVEKQAREYANGDPAKEFYYLDSIASEPVYNFIWVRDFTFRECKEREINLGLDLKGGMNVTLQVSVEDIVKSLSNNNTDSTFLKAFELAKTLPGNQEFITRFGTAFETVAPNARLAPFFQTRELSDRITFNSTNQEVIEVIRAEAEGAISNSFNIIRNRIDRFGVSQPNIQRLENSGRILVELPGVKEPERVRKLLQGTASLEFWETYDNQDVYPILESANRKIKEIRDAQEVAEVTEVQETRETAPADSTGNELVDLLKQEGAADTSALASNAQIEKEFPLFAKLKPSAGPNNQLMPGPAVGLAHYRDTAAVNALLKMPQVKTLFPRDIRFLWTIKPVKWDKTESLYELIAIKVSSRDGKAPLDGSAVTEAREEFGNNGGSTAEVSMVMNAEGSKTWARLTADNIGSSIAIVLDDYVYSYPRVNDEIKGGRSSITGDFTVNEAKDLANVLKSGKLPAPARIIQEEIVGPSLGKAAINSGFTSFLLAFVVVLIFMLFYYSVSAGLIADIALIANLFFLIGILASFGATLTLPGIAGIVLTLGMAVDANVLVFERIREELRSGKGDSLSISEGYKNAYSAIIDGNVTTLLTGIILYIFGSGPIRGFATTLVIGILTSLFSALFLTRLIVEMMAKRKGGLRFSTRFSEGAFKNAKFDFIGSRKIAYIISSGLMIIFIASLAIRGLNPGIDFAGGRTYVVKFDQSVSTVDIAADLKDVFGNAPEVKTFGDDNQVKITTKYKIDAEGENVDNEVDSLLYIGVKNLLPENTDLSAFRTDYKQSSMKVGPTIAHDIKRDAVIAVFLALIAIFLYILIRFKNWRFSTGAVASLAHDTIVVIGVFSILYNRVPFSMEIDQAFIAAILTIIGYSINDTVIIFDRIREYLGLHPKRDRVTNINSALNDTLSRTFATSFSTLVVLIPIFFFGGEVIRGFIFGLIIGILIGTYSSLFVASPIAYDLEKKASKKNLK
ncbi:MAG: protein translocase subunit SecDF [Bacteroidales bacterium]|nr:protein translocase subunit SecDF [Bacteroidales bacterium]MBN2750404.1 protein translocase subunit SecDF [Bacteroidales bacterium]